MRCADENQLVMLVRVEGSKSEAAEKCRQGKCILLTSLFIDEWMPRGRSPGLQGVLHLKHSCLKSKKAGPPGPEFNRT